MANLSNNINPINLDSYVEISNLPTAYSFLNEIESSMWISKAVCHGRLVEEALERGVKLNKAIKAVAKDLDETGQAVRKGAKLYTTIIGPRIENNQTFPLSDKRFYDIAIRYDVKLNKTPLEILEFIEDRAAANDAYTPMQAKIDLGLVDDTPSLKMIKNIIGIADADSSALEEAKPLIIAEYSQKVTQARKILENLIPESVPEP